MTDKVKKSRHYEEKQAEQSAKQPANLIGYPQDLLAGSEARLMRGVVGLYLRFIQSDVVIHNKLCIGLLRRVIMPICIVGKRSVPTIITKWAPYLN